MTTILKQELKLVMIQTRLSVNVHFISPNYGEKVNVYRQKEFVDINNLINKATIHRVFCFYNNNNDKWEKKNKTFWLFSHFENKLSKASYFVVNLDKIADKVDASTNCNSKKEMQEYTRMLKHSKVYLKKDDVTDLLIRNLAFSIVLTSILFLIPPIAPFYRSYCWGQAIFQSYIIVNRGIKSVKKKKRTIEKINHAVQIVSLQIIHFTLFAIVWEIFKKIYEKFPEKIKDTVNQRVVSVLEDGVEKGQTSLLGSLVILTVCVSFIVLGCKYAYLFQRLPYVLHKEVKPESAQSKEDEKKKGADTSGPNEEIPNQESSGTLSERIYYFLGMSGISAFANGLYRFFATVPDFSEIEEVTNRGLDQIGEKIGIPDLKEMLKSRISHNVNEILDMPTSVLEPNAECCTIPVDTLWDDETSIVEQTGFTTRDGIPINAQGQAHPKVGEVYDTMVSQGTYGAQTNGGVVHGAPRNTYSTVDEAHSSTQIRQAIEANSVGGEAAVVEIEDFLPEWFGR